MTFIFAGSVVKCVKLSNRRCDKNLSLRSDNSRFAYIYTWSACFYLYVEWDHRLTRLMHPKAAELQVQVNMGATEEKREKERKTVRKKRKKERMGCVVMISLCACE